MVVGPGTYLRLHMRFKGLNQVDLYKAMKINQATVSLLINNKQNINVGIALKLEKVLNVPAIYWLHWQAEYGIYQERIKHENDKAMARAISTYGWNTIG